PHQQAVKSVKTEQNQLMNTAKSEYKNSIQHNVVPASFNSSFISLSSVLACSNSDCRISVPREASAFSSFHNILLSELEGGICHDETYLT
ncbi:hypothetical protein L9F63_011959, partial [Diploptera punctata]